MCASCCISWHSLPLGDNIPWCLHRPSTCSTPHASQWFNKTVSSLGKEGNSWEASVRSSLGLGGGTPLASGCCDEGGCSHAHQQVYGARGEYPLALGCIIKERNSSMAFSSRVGVCMPTSNVVDSRYIKLLRTTMTMMCAYAASTSVLGGESSPIVGLFGEEWNSLKFLLCRGVFLPFWWVF